MGKRAPLGRLQKLMHQRLRKVYLVQPMINKWNVVIVEVRHVQQIFPTLTSQLLDAHSIDVGDIEFLIVVLWCRNRDNMA
jgi:hypothetical protein